MKKDDDGFELQIQRMGMASGARTQRQLAKLLGISQASVSEAFKRQTIPPRWLLILLEKLSVNPLWVISGKLPVVLEVLDSSEAEERGEHGIKPAILKDVPLQSLLDEIARRSQKMQ